MFVVIFYVLIGLDLISFTQSSFQFLQRFMNRVVLTVCFYRSKLLKKLNFILCSFLDTSFSTFLPGLPPPPKSEPDATGRPAPIFDVSSTSSSDDESDEEDEDRFYRDDRGNNFFKL